MKPKSSLSPVASLLLSILFATTLSAQTVPARLKVRPSDSTQSGVILLDVIATAHPGQTLSPKELLLFDNRKQVPAASLQLLTGPTSASQTHQLLFIIDAINSSLAEVTRSEDALEALFRADTTLPQPTSILIVSDTEPRDKTPAASTGTTAIHQRQLFVHRIPPSTDPAALLHALRDFKPGLQRILEAQSGPGQAERVRLSLESLSFLASAQTPIPGAKVVIWISPGWPYLQSSSAKSNEQLFDSIVYFSNLLRSARILLNAVSPAGLTAEQFPQTSFAGPRNRANPTNIGAPSVTTQPSDTFYQGFLKAPRNPAESNPNHLALQVLAIQSGGLVLQHSNDLASLLAQCTAETDSLLTLAYEPPPGDGSDRYHELSLKSSSNSQSLRTRTGFYLH